jgi:integrase/recombinase XerC
MSPLALSASPRDGAARLVSAFLAGRNARTMQAYSKDLEDFRAFLGADDVAAAAAALLGGGHGEANALALTYKAHLTDRGLAAATINRRLAALRSLVKLARVLGRIAWMLEVQNAKAQPYRDTRGPGRSGFRAMLGNLGDDGPKTRRDRAILRLLYERGLRRGEVVALDLEDVDLAARTIAVLGKGRTAKEPLTIAPSTAAALAAWIEVRGKHPGPLFEPLDHAHRGRTRLTGAGVYEVVRELGLAVGLHVRPHGLRHAGITEALERTRGNLRAVQRFSRHRDLRLLLVYDDNREDLGGEVARLVAEA